MDKTYSGFIAIVGPTNAGKSTLMNQIMGRKVSIVSHKVQTTRTNLRAIKMVGNRQLIFVDTPGIFRPSRRLDRAMVGAAMDATGDADAILLVIDAQKGITDTVRKLVEKIRDHKNLFVALNKIDTVPKPDLLPLAAEINELIASRDIFMISALKNDGVDEMLHALAAVMPAGPYLFDAHDATDVPDNLYLAELTREKIYKYIHQELPYHINVVTERVDVDDDGKFAAHFLRTVDVEPVHGIAVREIVIHLNGDARGRSLLCDPHIVVLFRIAADDLRSQLGKQHIFTSPARGTPTRVSCRISRSCTHKKSRVRACL